MLPTTSTDEPRLVISNPKPPHKRFPLIELIIGLMLVVVPVVILTWYASTTGQVAGVNTTLSVPEIISTANAARQLVNIPPLHVSAALNAAAQAKAQALIDTNTWGHTLPDIPAEKFILESGYSFVTAGENLAKDFDSAERVVNAWLDSPAHKKNLLSESFTDTGIGIASGTLNGKENTVVIVQYLASPYTPSQPLPAGTTINQTPILTQTPASNILFFLIGFIGVICLAFILGIYTKHLHQRRRSTHQHPAISHWHK